jgi:hypothetical protein
VVGALRAPTNDRFWEKNGKNGISLLHHDIPLCIAHYKLQKKSFRQFGLTESFFSRLLNELKIVGVQSRNKCSLWNVERKEWCFLDPFKAGG